MFATFVGLKGMDVKEIGASAAQVASISAAIILLSLQVLKTASLVHGLAWLFNPKSHDVGLAAQTQMTQRKVVDWEWLERTRGHARLFDRRLRTIRPTWLRRAVRICWRAYVLVPVSSVYCLTLSSMPERLRPNDLFLAVAAGCLLVAFLTLVHSGFKWLRWTDADVSHWANSLPGPFEQWRVADSKYGRMIANWVVLTAVGAFGFAAIYSALYSVNPTGLTRSAPATAYGIPDWLASGISYGAAGVAIDGAIGSYLHAFQLAWGFLVLMVVPVTYLSRGNG
jgi:hypothetical protein